MAKQINLGAEIMRAFKHSDAAAFAEALTTVPEASEDPAAGVRNLGFAETVAIRQQETTQGSEPSRTPRPVVDTAPSPLWRSSPVVFTTLVTRIIRAISSR